MLGGGGSGVLGGETASGIRFGQGDEVIRARNCSESLLIQDQGIAQEER